MSKPKIRAFRFELAICIGAPIVVLLAIAIPGASHIRTVKNDILQRKALLDEIPVIEHRLSVANQVMAPYRVKNGGKDKSGELSQQVNKAALDEGIKVKAVNAEKVALPESPYSLDYRVSMSGEGGLGAMVRMMDALDRPGQCIRVSSVRLRAKTIIPRPVYDADWQFQYRYIPSVAAPVAAVPGGVDELIKRLGVAVDVLKGLGKGSRKVLDTAKLENRKAAVVLQPVPVAPDTPVSFRLHGIAEDGRVSLALTDRGVFGVGDSVDGYRIIKVAKDHIIVESKQGRQELISLYKNEVNP